MPRNGVLLLYVSGDGEPEAMGENAQGVRCRPFETRYLSWLAGELVHFRTSSTHEVLS